MFLMKRGNWRGSLLYLIGHFILGNKVTDSFKEASSLIVCVCVGGGGVTFCLSCFFKSSPWFRISLHLTGCGCPMWTWSFPPAWARSWAHFSSVGVLWPLHHWESVISLVCSWTLCPAVFLKFQYRNHRDRCVSFLPPTLANSQIPIS